MTLTEFLMARIAEDEAVAQSGDGEGHEHAGSALIGASRFDGEREVECVGASTERVLAECAAKRRIVDTYEGARQASKMFPSRDEDVEGAPLTADLGQGLIVRGMIVGLKEAVQALALPYAEHPDYRQEWKP